MNGFETLGKWLVVTGVGLALLGGLLWLISRVPFLGHLPGDIRVERPGFTCLVPLASSIIISVLLTIILNLVARLFSR